MFQQSLRQMLVAKAQSIHKNCIYGIVGYLIIDINENNKRSKQVVDYMQSQQLQDITKKYSTKTKSLLDHIWTNLPIAHCEVSILDAYWIDHDVLHDFLQFM